MVNVEIGGKQFPLCLTVAAVDKINAKCGSLRDIGAFLDGKTEGKDNHFGKMIVNTAWMLGLLIREGEENRLVMARLYGDKTERREVPDQEAIYHMLTVESVTRYRIQVIRAVNESMTQEIEALHPKNVADAERK